MHVLTIIGLIVMVCGVVCLFLKKSNEKKLTSLLSAETYSAGDLTGLASSVAGEIGKGSFSQLVKVNGNVECDTPVTGQLSNEKCVFYRTSVRRDYEETYYEKDDQGNNMPRTRRGTEHVSNSERSTPFYIRDETGRVRVDPKGAEIHLITSVNKYEPANAVGFSGNTLSWKGFSFNMSSGNRSMQGRNTIGYTFSEEIFPLNQQAFVLGEATDRMQELTITKPTEGNFIISTKTGEGLAEEAKTNIERLKIAFMACLGIGFIMAVAGLFL